MQIMLLLWINQERAASAASAQTRLPPPLTPHTCLLCLLRVNDLCCVCCVSVLPLRWSKTCARTAAASPYGQAPGWGLRGAIIKSGDDCRQELLALQLIRELQDIWAGGSVCVRWVLKSGF